MENCGISEKKVNEILGKNKETFLQIFRTLDTESHSRKKHLPFDFLTSAGIPTHKRGDAKKIIEKLLKSDIFRIDSGKSVKFSKIGSKISKVLFNQEFTPQKKRISSFETIKINIGVKNI